jgi:hypothetical protein
MFVKRFQFLFLLSIYSIMKLSILSIVTVLIVIVFTDCNSGPEVRPVFCDTTCSNDTIKFTSDNPNKPRVYISMSDCLPDTVIWSYKQMDNNLKLDFSEMAGSGIRINKNFMKCYFVDTAYVWLEFNDCITGRGYLSKLSFNTANGRSRYTSALTHFDPKNKIDTGLIAYFDNTFLYVQDVYTGKEQKIKIADDVPLEIDYDNFHAVIDSVNITRNRIFVNVIRNGKKVPLEKSISF